MPEGPEAAKLIESVESIPPLPRDRQPVIWVSLVEDAGAGQVVRHEINFLGVNPAAVSSGRPTTKQLEYRIQSALNGIKRFRVPSYEQIKRLKKMVDDGIIEKGAGTWALTPHFAVDCTVLECAQTTSKNQRGGWRWYRTSKSESNATVRLGVSVTSLADGQIVWQGEAVGTQSSKSSGITWRFPGYSHRSDQSATPTLDDAIKLCVYDLTKKLADHVAPLGDAAGTP